MNSAGFDDKFATEKAQRGAATMMGQTPGQIPAPVFLVPEPETRNSGLKT